MTTQYPVDPGFSSARKTLLLSFVKHRIDVERVGSGIRQVRIRQRDWLMDKLDGLNARIPYDEFLDLRDHLRAFFGSLEDVKKLWVITSENRQRDLKDLRAMLWGYFPDGEPPRIGVKP